MTIRHIVFGLLVFFSSQTLNAQDKIFTNDGVFYEVKILKLEERHLVYRNWDDPQKTNLKMGLDEIKDFIISYDDEQAPLIDPELLIAKIKAINSGMMDEPSASDASELISADESSSGISVLEENYLRWMWANRRARVNNLLEGFEQDVIVMKKVEDKVHSLQVDFIALYNRAFNLRYKLRFKDNIIAEAAIAGFDVNESRKGGSGFAVEGGFRFLVSRLRESPNNLYNRSRGLSLGVLAGFTSANTYGFDGMDRPNLWNRSFIYFGPDCNYQWQLYKYLFLDFSVGLYKISGDHTLLYNEEGIGQLEREIIDPYNDGLLIASNHIATRVAISLGFRF